MGYYIQTPLRKQKAAQLCAANKEAAVIPQPRSFADVSMTLGLICIVDNGPFEAACFCHNEREFLDFLDPTDPRPKVWLIMNRRKAEIQSGFAKE